MFRKNFIKLTTSILNIKNISKIIIYKNDYEIYHTTALVNGYILFSSGFVSSDSKITRINDKKNPEDYVIFTKWINEEK